MGDEYGYPNVDPELRVCASCFNDEGLRRYIEAHADSNECSFCGARADTDIAASLDDLIEHMKACLARDYNDPDNAGMSYITREGGYQGEVWDSQELLVDQVALELPNDDDGALLEALVDGLGDKLWCDTHLYDLGPDEALKYSWKMFCTLLKHNSRYFFQENIKTLYDDRELLNPSDLLRTIIDYAYKVGLVRTLNAPGSYYRARFQNPGEAFSTAKELGPPPPDKAAQNRMSPAGIVMTYVSEDQETAISEAVSKSGTYAVGLFESLRDLLVLDLAELPPTPSLFEEHPDSLDYDPRHILLFLHHLADQISRQIVRDERVHIEYVPTQVVTEFVRNAISKSGSQFDGIRYRSSRRKGGISLVLFADQTNVVGALARPFPTTKTDEWLKLSERTETVVNQDNFGPSDINPDEDPFS